MLRWIIIVLACVGIPLGIWYASEYGKIPEVMFAGAIEKAETSAEGDQAPKVIILAVVHDVNGNALECTDPSGRNFSVDYSGSAPKAPFSKGMTVRFVGHVHGGAKPYFHATQVYAP